MAEGISAPTLKSATSRLRATEGGVLKALQMLANFVHRSNAERKLVIEVIEENLEADNLGAAFETLIKQIDPPPNDP